MKNLIELLSKECKHYSNEEMDSLVKRSVNAMGSTIHIVIAMEEIAELIEVIANNMQTNVMNIDQYVNTAEEIADLNISRRMIRIAADLDINTKDYTRCYVEIDPKSFISHLAAAQKKLSKYLRYQGDKSYAMEAYKLIDGVLYEIYGYYCMKSKDVNKIQDIKMTRFEKRTIEAEEVNRKWEEVK